MAFSRAAALRSCFRAGAARPTIARPQLCRQIARRTYASGGHGSAKAGGDAVWAAGAIAVTVPSCWFILSNAPEGGHHGDHGAHGHSSKEHKEKAKPEEEAKEETKDAGDSETSDDAEESDSGDEGKEIDTPDTSDDEGKEETNKAADEVKPEGSTSEGETGNEATTSEPAGKQEGQSITETEHSTDIANDPSKSEKGEGAAKTA
ncbi:hypothetical protein BGZ60DRAFT_408600 [Tricladium varicosporioides]|nr:hypothetical protein BGZ60DRAFT_408600 [Hymenoscyphus varicosporioides]